MRLTIHLFSNALRYGHGSDSPRLCTRDHLSLEVWFVTVAHELGYPDT